MKGVRSQESETGQRNVRSQESGVVETLYIASLQESEWFRTVISWVEPQDGVQAKYTVHATFSTQGDLRSMLWLL